MGVTSGMPKKLVKQGEFKVFDIRVLNKFCNALPLTNLGLLNPELSLIWVMLVPACTLTLCALCQFSRVTSDKLGVGRSFLAICDP